MMSAQFEIMVHHHNCGLSSQTESSIGPHAVGMQLARNFQAEKPNIVALHFPFLLHN